MQPLIFTAICIFGGLTLAGLWLIIYKLLNQIETLQEEVINMSQIDQTAAKFILAQADKITALNTENATLKAAAAAEAPDQAALQAAIDTATTQNP